jgi:PiT family inorganic phosphate transporter
VALVSGNNLSITVGNIIGSRITSKKLGISIAILGYISGFIIENNFMRHGIFNILPHTTNITLIYMFAVAIIIFIISHKMRIPQSLSITFTFIILGVDLATNSAINYFYVIWVVAFWISFPLIILYLAKITTKIAKEKIENLPIWKSIKALKYVAIIVTFFTAFTLGANTIGLVYSILPENLIITSVFILAIIFGTILLSGNELKTISSIIPIRYLNSVITETISLISVEVATLFGIPLSNTQTYTFALYGAGAGYKNKAIVKKPLVKMLYGWVSTAIIGFAITFILVAI